MTERGDQMFERILLPLDGSANSEKIIGWSEGLAESFGSELVLLNVVDPDRVVRPTEGPGRDRPDREAHPLDQPGGITESSSGNPFTGAISVGTGEYFGGTDPGYGTQAIEQVAQYANAYLNGVASRLSDRGFQVRAMVTIGTPEDEILSVADAQNVDLITMATHRESALARGILGSVTDRVIHLSSRPVLTIRPESVSESKPMKPAVILVPLDGSEASESTVSMAMEVAKILDSELVFVRVTNLLVHSAMAHAGIYESSPVSYARASDLAEEYLQNFVDEAKKRSLVASMRAPTGNTVNTLISIADENENTLTVMATRGRSGLARLVVGSVTDKVVRTSGHPVLVVPPEQVESDDQ